MLQGKILKIIIIIEIFILLAVLIFGFFKGGTEVYSKAGDWFKSVLPFNEETSTTQEETTTKQNDQEENFLSEKIVSKISEMTLEEKVSQMFIITPESLTEVGTVIRAGDTSKESINEYPVGGLVFSGRNLSGSVQAKEMLEGFQDYSIERIDLELFIAIEEEGGEEYSPVADLNVYENEKLPYEIGLEDDVALVSSYSNNISTAISELGFNTNLSPIVDLASTYNEKYDNRTFGSNSGVVSIYISEQIDVSNENGVYPVMKYFPGKSYATGNDSLSFPVNERTIEELRANEFSIYKSGIDSGASMIMLANVFSEAITGDTTTPCSLSVEAVNILRDELGYRGIIMTDSLSDDYITGAYDSSEAAIEAVLAGVDVIYNPADFKGAYQAVIDGVEAGDIDESLIDSAVAHILTVKMND